jgi:hypothetical protein
MSRNPINGESFSRQLKKGMESMTTLTIVDPGKLRVPFGGSGGKTARKPSWATVASAQASTDSHAVPEEHVEACELDMSTLSSLNHVSIRQQKQTEAQAERSWEIPGWALSVGYALFGLGLAMCNLLSPHHAGKICAAASPLPVVCLTAQSLAVMVNCRQRHQNYSGPNGGMIGCFGLILSALLLPSACAFWSLHIAVPVVLVLSLSVFACLVHRDVVAWVCLCGVGSAILLTLPSPMHLLEPRWGVTISVFFASILCFLSGLGLGKFTFSIKI